MDFSVFDSPPTEATMTMNFDPGATFSELPALSPYDDPQQLQQQQHQQFDVVDNAKNVHTPQFVCPDEEAAITDILLACQTATGNQDNGAYYIERDPFGHVIALMDVGKEAPGSAHTLSPSSSSSRHHYPQWDMPPSIGRLVYLQRLTVYHCRSLPEEVRYCTHLKELSLKFCRGLQALPTHAFAFLTNLTDLRIHGSTGQGLQIIPSIRTLPALRYLYCRASCPHGGSSSAPTVASSGEGSTSDGGGIYHGSLFRVEDLLHESVAFRNTLELLEIEGAKLTESDVAVLFGQVLPKYQNLHRVFLPNNHIRTLGPIVHATKQTMITVPGRRYLPPTIRLRALNLLGNPVLDFTTYGKVDDKNDGETQPSDLSTPTQDEQDALLREQKYLLELVTLHEELSNLGFGFTESALCTTEILLMLDLNDAGRVLLSPQHPEEQGAKEIEPNEESQHRFARVPLSVWSTVLERAAEQQGYHPSINAVYQLLKSGQIVGRGVDKVSKTGKRHRTTRVLSARGSHGRQNHKRKADEL